MTAPGQGAQTPGFLAPWLEVPGIAERLGAWSDLAGVDLIKYGVSGSAEEITDTAVAQPLLVAAALAVAERLLDGLAPDVVAGHSVGEFAAGAIAGVLSQQDAIRLTGIRGRAMAAAAKAEQTSMTAVLGGDEKVVLAALERHGLTPANVNAAGQIVAGGTLAELAAFADEPPPGVRLRPLRVAGAFHTRHMEPAVATLREAAETAVVRDPAITVLSNADGKAVRSGADWLARVVAQIAAPVRWDKCMATMSELGITALVELPPAGTLTGLAKRALPGVELITVKTPDQLAEAAIRLKEHADTVAPGPSVDWRIVVSPASGVFRPAGATPGDAVPAAFGLGQVDARGGARPVTSPWPAVLVEWLAEDGDPVGEGQPLARLQPEQV